MDGRAFRLRGRKGNALPQYSMHPFCFLTFSGIYGTRDNGTVFSLGLFQENRPLISIPGRFSGNKSLPVP
jgi:hypothetical protein